MRDIKFRGQLIENKGWVYGYFVIDPNNNYRIYQQSFIGATSNTYFFVDYKTIGQFTGLKDKNGVEIFNADIFSDKWKAEVYQNDEGTFMVRFHNNPKVNKPRSLKKYLMDRDIAGTSDRDCSVIGNIYQNPELLETVQK